MWKSRFEPERPGAPASSPGGLSMRMQGGRNEGGRVMRQGRKPVGFAAILLFSAAWRRRRGFARDRGSWSGWAIGRKDGGVLWKAWKARPRARQGRWRPVRCVGEGADALPTFPTGKDEWRRQVWKARKAHTPPVRTGSGSPQRRERACALPALPTPTPGAGAGLGNGSSPGEASARRQAAALPLRPA